MENKLLWRGFIGLSLAVCLNKFFFFFFQIFMYDRAPSMHDSQNESHQGTEYVNIYEGHWAPDIKNVKVINFFFQGQI